MAVFTYPWNTLPRTSLDPSYPPTSGDIDDIYVDLPAEAHGILTAVSFSGGSWYYHQHSGTPSFEMLGRVKETGEWHLFNSVSTSGQINLNGFSVTGITLFEENNWIIDAIRLRSTPFQSTAFHSMTASGDIAVDVKARTGVAGSGGGGGSGSGNMFGAFALGSTMLGADPSGGAGGSGSGGTGNMFGSFWLGQTMLGADPSGGGGDAPPITAGAIHQAQAVVAGLANVTGAFATFIWQVAAAPAGVATIQNAYLNANWSLEATTINPTGITKSLNAGNHTITLDIGQGVRSRYVNWTVDAGVGNTNTSFGVTTYKRPLAGGPETSAHGVGGSAQRFYSREIDAGEGFYISRIVYTNQGHTVTWEWLVEPQAIVQSVIFSPIGLRASFEAGATVTGSMSVHMLDGETCAGEASVVGEAYRVILLKPQGILPNSQVVADLQNVKDLFATSVGEASLQAEAVLTDVVFGTSSVVGDLILHNTRGHAIGISTVVANMRRNEGFQGDGIGNCTVTANLRLQMFLATGAVDGLGVVTANLTYPAPLSGGTSSGQAIVSTAVAVYNMNGSVAAGQAMVYGHFGYVGPMAVQASCQGQGSMAGDFRLRGRLLAQPSVGSASVTGKLIRVWFVEGQPAGEATVTFDTLVIHTIPPSPIIGSAVVVAHATHDARYGGQIVGDSSVLPTFPYVQTTVGTASPQGTSDVRAYLYVRPQDFETGPSSGTAAVKGQILLVRAAMNAVSQGGRFEIPARSPNGEIIHDSRGIAQVAGYDNTLAKGHLGIAFFFKGISRGEGFAEFELALLLLNDSGLIRGNSRLDVTLDRWSTDYRGVSNGRAAVRGEESSPYWMAAECKDAYSGVGTWFPTGFARRYYSDYSLTMAPIPDRPEHTGLPGNALWHGASHSSFMGEFADYNATRDTWKDGHVWDGTYNEWTLADVPGLNFRNYPELWDPNGPQTPNQAQSLPKYPGPLRRKYQLLAPGIFGTWMVDTRGPGFRDKAMRAGPVGEARFDEPQSTVDMDLELKSSMRGVIIGEAVVAALALLLSYRTLLLTGNVTALRYLFTTNTGGTTKSTQAQVPITQADAERLRPVHKTAALYT